jgi:hypothetical protein
MDRATGLLLEHNGINLMDAESGVVNKLPNVPYVTPSTTDQSQPSPVVPAPPPATQPPPTQPQ